MQAGAGAALQTVSDGPDTQDIAEYEEHQHQRRQFEGLSPPSPPSPSLSAGGSCDDYVNANIHLRAKRSLLPAFDGAETQVGHSDSSSEGKGDCYSTSNAHSSCLSGVAAVGGGSSNRGREGHASGGEAEAEAVSYDGYGSKYIPIEDLLDDYHYKDPAVAAAEAVAAVKAAKEEARRILKLEKQTAALQRNMFTFDMCSDWRLGGGGGIKDGGWLFQKWGKGRRDGSIEPGSRAVAGFINKERFTRKDGNDNVDLDTLVKWHVEDREMEHMEGWKLWQEEEDRRIHDLMLE